MRLIDIDAINWYDDLFMKGVNHSGVWVRYRDVEHLIRNAPIVDAVPVVRCRECDMWNEEDFSGRKSLGNYRCACAEWSNMEDGRRVYTGPDEFCSRGERREEEHDER